MPNHWHFVLWPEADGQLAAFMQRLTNTHVQRWQRHRRRVGEGHLYQGRYKSFPVQDDEHFYQVVRYVERNALRANLVARAEHWNWTSLAGWKSDHPDETWPRLWPLSRPVDWAKHVNRAQSHAELEAIRKSLRRGRPLGDAGGSNKRPNSSGWSQPFATAAGRKSQRDRQICACPEWHCRIMIAVVTVFSSVSYVFGRRR